MESVPKFWSYEKFLSCDDLLIEGSLNSSAHLDFIAVSSGTVYQPVSWLNRRVNDFLTDLIWQFPGSEANHWHLVSGLKSEMKAWLHCSFSFEESSIDLPVDAGEGFTGMHCHFIVHNHKISNLPWNCSLDFIGVLIDAFQSLQWNLWKIPES